MKLPRPFSLDLLLIKVFDEEWAEIRRVTVPQYQELVRRILRGDVPMPFRGDVHISIIHDPRKDLLAVPQT